MKPTTVPFCGVCGGPFHPGRPCDPQPAPMTRERLQEIEDEVAVAWPIGTADADLLPAVLLRELIAALDERIA